MIPRTLSATALQTASLCLARFHAEHIVRSKGAAGDAALAGSAAHGALEMFVVNCYLKKEAEPTLDLLLVYYELSYVQTFGSSDFDTEIFREGVAMLKAWHKRTDFSTFTVLSAEVKESFPIPAMVDGVKVEIPFNYILDRFDDMGDDVYRVNDYKTNRWGVTPSELRNKIQARCYALAMQIKFPNAKQIWVEFDMLRHDGPVGVTFTREDNIATWKWLKREAQRIIDTPDDRPIPETINPECNFCVRKSTCGTVRKNILVGGILSFGTVLEIVDKRAELEYQKKAIAAAIDEMDTAIIAAAKEEDIFEFETEMNKLTFASSSRRSVDADRVFMVIGPDLARKYGGSSIKMADFDALITDPSLTPQQKKQLSGLVFSNRGEPRVAVKPQPSIK